MGPGDLSRVLAPLPVAADPRLIVGRETFDDAGVVRLSADLALVQTVDFFAPVVDDAYAFGRIAAANALSDVYAMGGEPLTALNIAAFPSGTLPIEVLSEILRGGQDKVHEAGAFIVGGHTAAAAVEYTNFTHTGLIMARAGWSRLNGQGVVTDPKEEDLKVAELTSTVSARPSRSSTSSSSSRGSRRGTADARQ